MNMVESVVGTRFRKILISPPKPLLVADLPFGVDDKPSVQRFYDYLVSLGWPPGNATLLMVGWPAICTQLTPEGLKFALEGACGEAAVQQGK